MRRQAILFDLDGTLVDSLPDIVASFRQAFTEQGLDAPPEAEVRARVGLPLETMIGDFASADRVPAVTDAYRRIYPQRFTEHSAPFPEVQEVLGTLRSRGYLLAVATTKRSATGLALVQAMGLAGLLDHVQGTDGFPAKPSPEVIQRALGVLGAEGLWMVGDTRHDVEAGRAAGLATYAVARAGSTHDHAALQAASPDRLEHSLSALLDLALG